MKRWKRSVTALLAVAMVGTLAACGAAKDPAKAASEKMSTVKNMDSQITMVMEMEAEGQTLAMSTDMAITMFNDPMKLKADVQIEISGMGTQAMTIYAEGAQDAFDIYMSADGITWARSAGTAAEVAEFNAKDNMATYMDSAVSFQEAGAETLDGGEAMKYTGVIPKANMEEILRDSGALDSLDSVVGTSRMDSETLKGLMSDLADLPVSIWVDKATGYPVKFETDMSAMMAILTEKMAAAMGAQDAGLKFTKMMLTMTFQNMDAAVDFEIPAEAKAA